MKYPWYSVTSRHFDGIHYGPWNEGMFDTLEEAKACYDSTELGSERSNVWLYEFYEGHCNVLFSKEREDKLPTPETMGRYEYTGRRKNIRRSKV